MALCTTFGGLDPVRMLDYPLVDVLDLIRDQTEYNRRKRTAAEPPEHRPPEPTNTHGERVIYRKADDSWF